MESNIIIVWPKGKLKINLKKSKPDEDIPVKIQVPKSLIKKGKLLSVGLWRKDYRVIYFGEMRFNQEVSGEGLQDFTVMIHLQPREDYNKILIDGTYFIQASIYAETVSQEFLEITFIT